MLTDWLFWGTGIALGIAGLVLAWWSLLADRPRGRRRCPTCWYDMSGTESLLCPECGHEAINDRRLSRTRRHWSQAWLCLLIFLGAYILWMQPRIRTDGWVIIMPRTLLILALRLPENDWAFAGLELRTQSDIDKLYPDSNYEGKVHDASLLYLWQWKLVTDTCIDLSHREADASKRHLLLTWLNNASDELDGEALTRCNDAMAIFLTDEDARVRSWAALACADVRDPERSIEWIVPLLNDPDQRVRFSATSGLWILGTYGPAPLDALLDALEHEDELVRQGATAALGAMAGAGHAPDDVFDRLLDVHEHDSSISVRVRALKGLARFESQRHRMAPIIRAAMQRPEIEYREEAVWTLTSIEPFDEELYLEVALAGAEDTASTVRDASCWLLQNMIKTDLLVPHRERLEALTLSDDECIRDAAKYHLSQMNEATDK